MDFDWTGAEQGFKRALELSPNSADTYDLYGRMCAGLERYEEAIAMQQRAHELDPLAHRTNVANALLRSGRYDEAALAAAYAVEFDPDHDRAHATLGWAYFRKGMRNEGLAELQRAVSLSPGTANWLAQLGEAHALAGQVDAAREILRQLEDRALRTYVSPYHLAFVHTGLGEQERALDLLEEAFDKRAGAMYGIKGSFLLAPLRSHPRFKALLKKNEHPAGVGACLKPRPSGSSSCECLPVATSPSNHSRRPWCRGRLHAPFCPSSRVTHSFLARSSAPHPESPREPRAAPR